MEGIKQRRFVISLHQRRTHDFLCIQIAALCNQFLSLNFRNGFHFSVLAWLVCHRYVQITHIAQTDMWLRRKGGANSFSRFSFVCLVFFNLHTLWMIRLRLRLHSIQSSARLQLLCGIRIIIERSDQLPLNDAAAVVSFFGSSDSHNFAQWFVHTYSHRSAHHFSFDAYYYARVF